MNEEQFRRLLESLLDGELSPEEGSAMESAMNENAEFQQIYLDAMQMHASLAWPRRWSINDRVDLPKPSSAKVVERETKRVAIIAVMASIAASLLFLILYQMNNPRNDEQLSAVAKRPGTSNDLLETTAPMELEPPMDETSVGVLSNVANVVWRNGVSRSAGKTLRQGWLRFDSGMVQVDFFGGARLIVRGPAEIELRSSSEALLRSGEATCYVGELGRGFRLLTGDSEVIDLGTSFGMRVVPDQKPEVHVFEGKIAIRRSSQSELMELNEKSAVRLDSNQLSPVEYSKNQFPGFEDLQDARALKSEQSYATWKANAETLSLDPSVLVHYTFEDQQQHDIEVLNRAQAESIGSPAAIIGAKWGDGRWPNKSGLHFRDRNDRVLFRVPGQHESITFLIWARLDALIGDRTALLLSEYPTRWILNGSMRGNELAESVAIQDSVPVKTSRWTLDRAGRPGFNLAFDGPRPATFQWDTNLANKSVAKQSEWGRWSCLAMTYDAISKKVIHYHNGIPIATMPVEHAERLLLQCMELGNLSRPTATSQSGDNFRFYGVIDEVLIAKRVFTEQEIAEIYETGNNAQ